MDFLHTTLAARARFGVGALSSLPQELEALDVRRVLVAVTPNGRARYADVIETAGSRVAGVFDRAAPHCPEPVALAALEQFQSSGADGVVTIGGGSTIGLGKYIAVKTGAPYLAVPTTPSGSELTPLYGVKIGTEKRTARDARAAPRTVIYDPALTLSLPPYETATIGMNCLAHCVEALYPKEPSPVAAMIAEAGVRALLSGLPAVTQDPDDLSAREQVMYGGFLGGLVVTMVGVALHHKLCHILGGHFGVPHGESNSVVLAYALAYNAPAAPEAVEALQRVFQTRDPAAAIHAFAETIGAPTSLGALGMTKDQLAPCAAELMSTPFYNPRPLDYDVLLAMLDDAQAGRAPSLNQYIKDTQKA